MTRTLPRSSSDSDIQNSLAHEPNFIYTQINERLLFTSSSMDQARLLLPPQLRKAHFIPENTSDCDIVVVEALIHPPGLASLYRFSVLLYNTTRRVHDKMIVVTCVRWPHQAIHNQGCSACWRLPHPLSPSRA
jgi:hypothetical protein